MLVSAVAENAENVTSALTKSSFQPYYWPHAGQTCYFRCKDAGFCCGGSQSSNQMISCTQACVMRARGTPENDLISPDGLCQRNSASGCSVSVNAMTYDLCSTCHDLTEKCPHGVESEAACQYGARTWTQCLLSGQEIVNTEGCDCAWILFDNCKSKDSCAQACRQANPGALVAFEIFDADTPTRSLA
eukprot:Skav221925  [mRNA]  locus=scaffold195:137086:137649:+ [translate_table: standard]